MQKNIEELKGNTIAATDGNIGTLDDFASTAAQL